MPIFLEKITIKTRKREDIVEITYEIRQSLEKARKNGIMDGVCRVFVPHTTAAITINENADPDVETDTISILNALILKKRDYLHAEGNSDSHVKASLMGFSCEVLMNKGNLILGTWQGIKFCEFDGPRTRNVYIQFMGE